MNRASFILVAIFIMILIQSYTNKNQDEMMENSSRPIVGMAPSLTEDGTRVYMAFAAHDSILFCFSSDKGKSFSKPVLVSELSKLGVGGGRGPQILSVKGRLIIAATDIAGNIYSFTKSENSTEWEKGGRINDVAEVAKEGFVSLATDNNGMVYAIWLDLRGDKKNKIAGARSLDIGGSWSKNIIIYKSPDSTVCECCKPSLAMKDGLIVVMFRNWLNGNRDLHIIQSLDGGLHFGKVQKLGEGNWKINGCPMDGGGLVINKNNTIYTVWRREGEIYSCIAGKKEEIIAEGKQCTVAGKSGNNYIAFMNKGNVYCRKPGGDQVKMGKGGYPKLTTINESTVLCAWENEGEILYSIISE
jgi:hypothetical protein